MPEVELDSCHDGWHSIGGDVCVTVKSLSAALTQIAKDNPEDKSAILRVQLMLLRWESDVTQSTNMYLSNDLADSRADVRKLKEGKPTPKRNWWSKLCRK